MDAWLKTHVALVSPLANALYMAGGDNYRLARTRDGVLLAIRAIREGFRVLQDLGIPVRPAMLWILAWMPEPILLFLLQHLLDTELAAIALAGHANAARDEMKHLADEFRALALSTTVPTPAMDCLYKYVDLTVPPVAQGRAQIAVNWRGIWVGLGVLTALAAVWRLRRHRRR
jgi:2-dehydropantoate 2-reductase